MRVAVVHDYFTQLGGAEMVARELVRMLPHADLLSTVAFPERMPEELRERAVKTTWIQHMPGIREYYRFYFLLYPMAVQSLDLSPYDLVISSSSGYAKGVRAHRDAIHICYCHNPMRWAWNSQSYSSRGSMGSVARILLPYAAQALREWDRGASRQPDHFVANSKTVAARIEQAYGRTAQVIHPPVNVNRFRSSKEQDDYYLVLSRLIPYKHIDLAVEACTRLGHRLMIIGDGPDRARLTAMAGPTVKFLGRLPDAEVERYASRCRALLFPGEEDFGLAPLEIAAAGRPTVAYRAGGATETMVEDVTGLFFDRPEADNLAAAIEQFENQEWHPDVLRRHAECFSVEVFQKRFGDFLCQVGCPVSQHSKPPQAVTKRGTDVHSALSPHEDSVPA